MQAKPVPGLYFIGEVVDVTGWLGGTIFNGPGRRAGARANLFEDGGLSAGGLRTA